MSPPSRHRPWRLLFLPAAAAAPFPSLPPFGFSCFLPLARNTPLHSSKVFLCASPFLPPFLGWSAGRLTGSLTKKGGGGGTRKLCGPQKKVFLTPSLVGGFFLPKEHCSSPSNHNVAMDRLPSLLFSPNYLDQIFPVKRRERV